MNQSSHMNRMIPEKSLLIHQDGLIAFRVSEFGGHPVPEEGLTLEIPGNGLLTVWPDGEYTCQDGGRSDESLVNTYFSYVVESSDGSSLVGSFSLNEGVAMPEGMQDFRAWSLPDLLDGAVESLMSGAGLEELEHSSHGAPSSVSHVEGLELNGSDPAFDDLTRLILDSHNS